MRTPPSHPVAAPALMASDFQAMAAALEKVLRLRAIPFGMKLCESVEAMQAVPRIRRPQAIHTLDQLVAQTARLGWTLGVTDDEMLMALPVEYIAKALQGMEALARNGLRYPFPSYGIQQDARAGMAASYDPAKAPA